MNPSSSIISRSSIVLAVAALVVACAKDEDAAPANVAISVDFPSTAAAVAVDGVKVYVFDAAQTCTDVIRLRQTAQTLPATVYESASIPPCSLRTGQPAVAFEIKRDTSYTMLAVGTAAGKDLLIGCTVQQGFGNTTALPVSLTYIDATQRIPDTNCAKLSDKCAGACK